MSTARIFSAAVARHFGAEAADVEDLKIALTEACGSAISHAKSARAEPVRITATPGGGMLTYEVNGHRRTELLNTTPSNLEQSTEEQMIALSAELIGALFPDAEFIDKAEGTFFRFSVLASAAS